MYLKELEIFYNPKLAFCFSYFERKLMFFVLILSFSYYLLNKYYKYIFQNLNFQDFCVACYGCFSFWKSNPSFIFKIIRKYNENYAKYIEEAFTEATLFQKKLFKNESQIIEISFSQVSCYF